MSPVASLAVLALPRSTAFAEGLLIPVSPYVRRRFAIPFPVRFTASAWLAVVAHPSRRGVAPTPSLLSERLDAVLRAVRHGLDDCRTYLLHTHAFTLVLSSGSVTVLASEDEDGADVLTIALPSEHLPFS